MFHECTVARKPGSDKLDVYLEGKVERQAGIFLGEGLVAEALRLAGE